MARLVLWPDLIVFANFISCNVVTVRGVGDTDCQAHRTLDTRSGSQAPGTTEPKLVLLTLLCL